jgi:putative flippase GtrA
MVSSVARAALAAPSRLARFTAVGVASTVAYVLIYVAMRDVAHAEAWVANLFGLVITGFTNTAANRRFTFGVRGRHGAAGDYAAGMSAFAVALTTTTVAAAALRLLTPSAPHIVEVTVLSAANLMATLFRYVALRSWIDGRRRQLRALAATAGGK